jgi:hypothetical protein
MTDLQSFLDMLTRAEIGHGKRYDHNPAGTGVQVETEQATADESGRGIVDFWFDSEGRLKLVNLCGEAEGR